MYHFVGQSPANPLIINRDFQVPGELCHYLKTFQLEALRFILDLWLRNENCILNDENGLGKSVTATAAIRTMTMERWQDEKTLIITENDDERITNWQFHLSVLGKMQVQIVNNYDDLMNTLYEVYIGKWTILRSLEDFNQFNYVVVDNRGPMMKNLTAVAFLTKNFGKKVNLLLSSVDITADVKLMHNSLSLTGHLEWPYMSYKEFHQKFHLPDIKEIMDRKLDINAYYEKREQLVNLCKNYRLKRFLHQYQNDLPFVTSDRHRANVKHWLQYKDQRDDDELIIDMDKIVLEQLRAGEEKSKTNVNKEAKSNEGTVSSDISSDEEEMTMEPLILSDSESSTAMDEVPKEDGNGNNNGAALDEGQNRQVRKSVKGQEQCTEVSEDKASSSLRTLRQRRQRQPANASGKEEAMNDLMRRTTNISKSKVKNPSEKPLTEPAATEKSPKSLKTDTGKDKARKTLSPPQQHYAQRRRSVSIVGAHARTTRSMKMCTTRSADSRRRSKYWSTDIAIDIDGSKRPTKKPRKGNITKNSLNNNTARMVPNAEETSKKNETKKNNTNFDKFKKCNPPNIDDVDEALKETPELMEIFPSSGEFEDLQCGQKFPSDMAYEHNFIIPELPQPLQVTPEGEQQEQRSQEQQRSQLTAFSDIQIISTNTQMSKQDIIDLSSSSEVEIIDDTTPTTTRKTPQQQQQRRSRILERKRQSPSIKPKSRTTPTTFQRISMLGPITALEQSKQKQKRNSKQKSPELFPTGSDLSVLASQQQLQQPEQQQHQQNNFQGFKIFGSEVKVAKSKTPTKTTRTSSAIRSPNAKSNLTSPSSSSSKDCSPSTKRYRSSCIYLLDQMFYNDNDDDFSIMAVKQAQQRRNKISPISKTITQTPATVIQTLLNHNHNHTNNGGNNDKDNGPSSHRCNGIDEDIFEITENRAFGSTMRVGEDGCITPIEQQKQKATTLCTQQQQQQHNKITNYLKNVENGGLGTSPATAVATRSATTTPIVSPAAKKNGKSKMMKNLNKITKWLQTSEFATATAPNTPLATPSTTPVNTPRSTPLSTPGTSPATASAGLGLRNDSSVLDGQPLKSKRSSGRKTGCNATTSARRLEFQRHSHPNR